MNSNFMVDDLNTKLRVLDTTGNSVLLQTEAKTKPKEGTFAHVSLHLYDDNRKQGK
ncbi:hypothetical protein PCASD_13113 [Puccinia coronata f. sp. avenae]|uniref:Uncharacterized protein n=1 Tax=Puccinia coronata f. sp. avenae TaxID=200324 RepID=A0A2N5UDC9_9BASI|nr:hypothetical protein PCASD_13113 [Puccinia coronata f. sp. avenae]